MQESGKGKKLTLQFSRSHRNRDAARRNQPVAQPLAVSRLLLMNVQEDKTDKSTHLLGGDILWETELRTVRCFGRCLCSAEGCLCLVCPD